MARFVVLICFLAITSFTVEAKSSNALIGKMECVVDTMDALGAEYKCEHLWQDIQATMLKNINNLFVCLQYSGFKLQR